VGTRVPIVTDAEMLQDPVKAKSYNFIFLGGLKSNSFQAKMQSESDVKPQIILEQDETLKLGTQCEIVKEAKVTSPAFLKKLISLVEYLNLKY
jgi:hypothetical protein